MPRYGIIDGLRGFFLVFMLVNHLVFEGGFWPQYVNHNQLAFVEDAQGFVFLSGLMIGLVYGRKMLREGAAHGRALIHGRAFELYRYAIGIVLAVLAARAVLPGAGHYWFNWLGNTALDGDPLRLAAIATFLFQPTIMDILPQYVIYMLAAPPVVHWCLRGRVAPVIAVSGMLWLAGQLGLQRFVTVPLDAWLTGSDGEGIRASFNLLGWQVVFFSGLAVGALTAANAVDWPGLFRADATLMPKICLALCLFFLPLRIGTAHDLLPQPVLDKIAPLEVRADFSLVYLVNFAAAATGLTWLLMAGTAHRRWAVRLPAHMMRWLFSLRFLRLLGRHSLHVYVWHVAIVYAVYYIDQRWHPLPFAAKAGFALAGVALLTLPALWRERRRGAPAAAPAPSPAGG